MMEDGKMKEQDREAMRDRLWDLSDKCDKARIQARCASKLLMKEFRALGGSEPAILTDKTDNRWHRLLYWITQLTRAVEDMGEAQGGQCILNEILDNSKGQKH